MNAYIRIHMHSTKMLTPKEIDKQGAASIDVVELNRDGTHGQVRWNKRKVREATQEWMRMALVCDFGGELKTSTDFKWKHPKTFDAFKRKMARVDETMKSDETYTTYFNEMKEQKTNLDRARRKVYNNEDQPTSSSWQHQPKHPNSSQRQTSTSTRAKAPRHEESPAANNQRSGSPKRRNVVKKEPNSKLTKKNTENAASKTKQTHAQHTEAQLKQAARATLAQHTQIQHTQAVRDTNTKHVPLQLNQAIRAANTHFLNQTRSRDKNEVAGHHREIRKHPARIIATSHQDQQDPKEPQFHQHTQHPVRSFASHAVYLDHQEWPVPLTHVKMMRKNTGSAAKHAT
jgi:hypothetical protein